MTTTLDPAPAPPSHLTAPRHRAFGLVVAAASVPMFMATLDNLVMTNALPVLHRDLGASVEELQWFVNAYTLAFAGAILLASALGDRFGRRTVFAIGIAVFGIGSVLAALSTDPSQLIVARAVQGLGGAGIFPLSLALLSGGVAPERRPLAIGIWGGVSGLGVAVGPLVGGAIMEGWNWQAIFWLNVPIAILAIPFALGSTQRSRSTGATRPPRRRHDRTERRPACPRDSSRQRRWLGLVWSHRGACRRHGAPGWIRRLAGPHVSAPRSDAAVP